MQTDFVDHATWLVARKALLEREKAFTRKRDRLSEARRKLPMVEVTADYVFETQEGQVSLSGLFGPHSQLLVYHFMFGKTWTEGCPSCSFWADNYDGLDIHLAARDTALVAVSNAPLVRLLDYRDRMGWRFNWASTAGSSFSEDFGVTFPGKTVKNGQGYNYTTNAFAEELPGISAFLKLKDGRIGHGYSTYGRGLDIINSAYNLLDLTPLGRQEHDLPHPMAWVRRRDQYGL